MSPTKASELEEDATKAAGACREELLRLTPPRLLRREAFSQDHSGWERPEWIPKSPSWLHQNPQLPV